MSSGKARKNPSPHQPPLNVYNLEFPPPPAQRVPTSTHHPPPTTALPMATLIPAQGSRSPQLSLSFAPAPLLPPHHTPSFIAVHPPTPTHDEDIAEKRRSMNERTSTANPLGPPPSPFPTPRRRGTLLHKFSQEFHRRSSEGVSPPPVKYLHPNDATRPITALVFSPPSSPRNSTHSAAGGGQQRKTWRLSRASRAPTVDEETEIFETSDADIGEHGRRVKEHRQRRQRGHIRTRSEQTQTTYMSSMRESMGSRFSRLLTREDFIMADLEKRRRRDFTIGSRHPLEAPPPSIQQVSEATEENEQYFLVNLMKKVWNLPWIADPIVSTLVIPRTGDEFPESWFKPKYMDADELAEEGLADVPKGKETGDVMNAPATNVQAPEPAYVGMWMKRAFGG
jgi:hypothetical protein